MPTKFNEFRTLFEKSADAILIIDHDQFIDCNQAAVDMLRYNDKNELLNTHPSELSPPFQADGRSSFEKAQDMMHIAYERGSHRFEWNHKRADDEVFPVEVLLTSIPMDNKTILHTVWRDITHRKQFEEKLKKSERTLKALFNHSFEFIGMLDLEGRVLAANQSAIQAAGIEDEDVIGRFFWDTPWWTHSKELQEKLKNAVKKAAQGEFVRFEASHLDADGNLIFVDFSLKPVEDENGQVYMLIPEGRDITEIRKTQAQLIQSQKMESVGTLASGIAHDFNNILGGILGTLSLMRHKWKKQDHETAQMEKYFTLMESSCERASQIVKQLLSLSKEAPIALVPVDLNECLRHVVGLLEHSIDKSVKICVEYYPSPLVIMAEPVQIEQVILNLCINASHAMTIMRAGDEKWGGKLRLHLGPEKLPNNLNTNADQGNLLPYACLRVEDSGVGISTDVQNQIYDPFFSTKTKEKGSGLGLSIIYNILTQLNGHISMTSEPGQGTTFQVFFPQEIGKSALPPENSTRSSLTPGTGLILVIEDEAVLGEVVESILVECGYSVLAAKNGKEGYKLFKEQYKKIDCVVMDMAMPVMSGKETFLKMKKLYPEVKVILASGYEQDKRVKETIDLGVKAFIKKPFTFETLSKTVSNVINEKHK